METINEIGETLKFYRQLNSLSQKDISAGICSQAEISKIENGKVIPTVELLHQLAKKLRVPVSKLVKDDAEHRLEHAHSLDQTLRKLVRENKFDECLYAIEQVSSSRLSDEVRRIVRYYEIVIAYRQHHVDYRTTSVLFTRLIDQEDLQVQDPILYFRVKMALSILYAECKQYQQAEKIFDDVLQLTAEINGLKEERLKVLYNYAKLLYKLNQSDKGLGIIEEGILLSRKLKQTSYLAHFYYQRGEFHERMEVDGMQTKHDYMMAYELFSAFQMKQYAEIVIKTKCSFLQLMPD
ncbi:helix-turn-helix domain-containing protein [uncultured Exiguobacterium sp.]|nr:helix-turn-helix domain-containing protein [uncultured Exiguobacterium sp.]